MESSIKRIAPADHADLARILAGAYPSPEKATEERRENALRQLEKELADEAAPPFYGLYREGRLLGAMRLMTYRMNLASGKITVGGIGGVCVDLRHKKEKVSYELLIFALRYFRDKGIHLAALYPFHPPFYKKMGFGLGTMAHQFHFQPGAFPNKVGKRRVDFLGREDQAAILDCYHRHADGLTGMFEHAEQHIQGYFGSETTIVGVRQGERITGYLLFRFNRTDYIDSYDMLVTELVYTDREALLELCAFLNSQADQVRRIIVNTQDEHLYYLMSDPTSGRFGNFMTGRLESRSTGIGLMYRVLDAAGLFRALGAHNFGSQTCRLKLEVADSFLEDGAVSCILHVREGAAEVSADGEFDTVMAMDIANFSSLIVGAVDFRTLFEYGLAELSDERWLDTVNRLFAADRPPRCHTYF